MFCVLFFYNDANTRLGRLFSFFTKVAKVTASFKQRTYNSCIELRKDGFNISKIYEIQPHADYPSYKVQVLQQNFT